MFLKNNSQSTKRRQFRQAGGLLLMCWLIILFCQPAKALSDDIQIRGYVQGMPLWLSADVPEHMSPFFPAGKESWWEYRLQNRLNLRWFVSSEWSFTWEMRTRLFAGDLVRDIPGYAEGLDSDDGLVNLSWLMVDQDDWLLHYIPDRLYLEWMRGDWSVRIGRQRVNWGITTITNPNDLFNIYSFYDFDYPERPGTDAIRLQRYTGFASRIELVVSPHRDIEQSVAAALFAFNTRGYDIQFIAGYYREKMAVGGGWAGNIGDAGFKGEVMGFIRLNDDDDPLIPSGVFQETGDRDNIITSVSVDYMFGNGIFLVTEFLYNKEGGEHMFSLIGETLRPDNPSFSRYQATTQAQYAFNPLLDGSVSVVWYPDEDAVFLSPSLTRSMMTDLDFNVFAQLFVAGDHSVFQSAGNVIAASLKWNF